MMITLLDMATLFGLQPYEKEISPRLKAVIPKCTILFKKEHVNYDPFININMKSTPVLDKA